MGDLTIACMRLKTVLNNERQQDSINKKWLALKLKGSWQAQQARKKQNTKK